LFARGQSSCRLNEKVEADPKEVKEAVVSFNASVADRWCRGTKQRSLRVECPLSSLNWQKSCDKKARTWPRGLTQNTIAFHVQYIVES